MLFRRVRVLLLVSCLFAKADKLNKQDQSMIDERTPQNNRLIMTHIRRNLATGLHLAVMMNGFTSSSS